LVRTIIKTDLKKKVYKKTKVHALEERHKVNRKRTCRKLYENRLAGNRSEYAVTLDEALFFLQDCNGVRKICYGTTKDSVRDFVRQKHEKFSKRFMIVGALTGRGPLPLIKVPEGVKVNSQFYIDHVLKPLLEGPELRLLYGNELHKIFVHHDLATSHTSHLTTAYAEDLKSRTGITIIPKEEIPVKAPDASPMDFFGFGYLKQRLFS